MYDRFQAFTVMILQINRCIHKIKTAEMDEFHLKSPHLSCLYYLYKENALTAKELRDICGEDKSYLSHSIKYLENHGYIRCTSDAQKRYNASFVLTESGKEIAQRIAAKVDTVIAPLGADWSEEERTIFYRCLSQICTRMQQACLAYEGAKDPLSSSSNNRKEVPL